MIHYISDTHFFHNNILMYDNRPFKDVDEMLECMVERWNAQVKPRDTVYHLGDVIWQSRYEKWVEILSRLNGKKFIIKGNHDESKTLKRLLKDGLILGWSYQDIISDSGRKVVLNHSPMPFFVNMHKPNYVHLYGHVHVSFDLQMTLKMQRSIEELYQHEVKMYHVGCMMPYMRYAPKTLDEMEAWFKGWDKNEIVFTTRKG
jgi:calcineurin-like phosphoesterase family protein